MINNIFTLVELTFKWRSKLFQENISSPGPSVSSGALFNSYTKCGVHHVPDLVTPSKILGSISSCCFSLGYLT